MSLDGNNTIFKIAIRPQRSLKSVLHEKVSPNPYLSSDIFYAWFRQTVWQLSQQPYQKPRQVYKFSLLQFCGFSIAVQSACWISACQWNVCYVSVPMEMQSSCSPHLMIRAAKLAKNPGREKIGTSLTHVGPYCSPLPRASLNQPTLSVTPSTNFPLSSQNIAALLSS